MFTAKKQKKINRQLSELEKRDNSLIVDQAAQYFTLFWLFLLFDYIAPHLGIRTNQGLNYEQIGACGLCIAGMLRCHWRMR